MVLSDDHKLMGKRKAKGYVGGQKRIVSMEKQDISDEDMLRVYKISFSQMRYYCDCWLFLSGCLKQFVDFDGTIRQKHIQGFQAAKQRHSLMSNLAKDMNISVIYGEDFDVDCGFLMNPLKQGYTYHGGAINQPQGSQEETACGVVRIVRLAIALELVRHTNSTIHTGLIALMTLPCSLIPKKKGAFDIYRGHASTDSSKPVRKIVADYRLDLLVDGEDTKDAELNPQDVLPLEVDPPDAAPQKTELPAGARRASAEIKMASFMPLMSEGKGRLRSKKFEGCGPLMLLLPMLHLYPNLVFGNLLVFMLIVWIAE